MSMGAALLMMAQAGTATLAPPPAGADPALAAAGERGRLIYAYDQAAWHGTDDLLAHHRDIVPKQGGYVVDGPAEAPRLVFFDGVTHRAIYVAHVVGGRVTDAATPTGADADLSPLDRRLVAARDAAIAVVRADAAARPCAAKPFNTVVVPPATPDAPVSVYFLTPQTTTASIPMGGHFRVDVDAGGSAGPIQRFTHACLDLPVNGGPAGSTQQAAVVSQLIGHRPTEIHVFASLTLRQPVYVITGADRQHALWTVTGIRIAGPRPMPPRADR